MGTRGEEDGYAYQANGPSLVPANGEVSLAESDEDAAARAGPPGGASLVIRIAHRAKNGRVRYAESGDCVIP